MKCANCGTDLQEGVSFCTECGTKVEEPSAGEIASVANSDAVADEEAAELSDAEPAAPSETAPAAAESAPSKSAPRNANTKRIAIISSIAAVLVICICVVGGLFAAGVFTETAVDEQTFPNPTLRAAVLEQLDANGNGRLSSEEAQSVVAIGYTGTAAFIQVEGQEADIRQQVSEAAAAGDPEGAPASLGDLSIFPELASLMVVSPAVTELDLSQNTHLQMVDCRSTNVTELDLSQNGELKSLLCNPSTVLTGLDEAGLYFEDLITAVRPESERAYIHTVSYDAMGRPTTYANVKDGMVKTYAYDEAGRLIRAENDKMNAGWYEAYTYGANGLLATAEVSAPLEVGAKPFMFYYGYDDNGRVAQIAEQMPSGEVAAGIIEYDNGKPKAMKTTDALLTLSADEAGRITSASAQSTQGSSTYNAEYTLTYAESGQLTGYSKQSQSAASLSLATQYGEGGVPAKTTATRRSSTSSGSGSFDIAYACNQDGYVTTAAWGDDPAPTMLEKQKLVIGYVKHVAPLADLPARRFVPAFRLGSSEALLSSLTGWSLNQDWYSSTGGAAAVSFLEYGPQQVVEQEAGLLPNIVATPHDQKLLADLDAQWSDGLTLGAAQPVTAETPKAALDKVAALKMPPTKQELLDDAVYGPVLKKYVAAAAKIAAGTLTDADCTGDLDFLLNVYGKANAYANGTFNVYGTYVDPNNDGNDELLIQMGSSVDGSSFAALYCNANGTAKKLINDEYREHCKLLEGGLIWDQGSGGAAAGGIIIYKLEGTQLAKIYELDFDLDYREEDQSKAMEIIITEAGKSPVEKQTSAEELESIRKALEAKYKDAAVFWTKVS